MPTFLTTAQKRKAKAEADYLASLGPKGAGQAKSRSPQRATPQQTMLGVDDRDRPAKNGALHRPDCYVLDRSARQGYPGRLATEEELASHPGCGHCA